MGRPSPALVVSFVALLVALSGVAWAAQLAENSVKSKHIKAGQVKTEDLGDGAVATVKLADGSVVTGKVADETLVGDDLADETVTGSKIADGTITGSKVDDASLTGADIDDDSLDGADIDEASLDGVALTSGDDCCTIREETLALGTAYSASDPSTFVDLPFFEIRTSTVAGENDKFQVCFSASAPSSVSGIVYAGGTRFTPSFPPFSRSCQTFDTNGASTSSTGDFEVILPVSVRVWGSKFSSDPAQVIVLEH